MYYEINVALNGKHYFATHPRSITDEGSAKRLYYELEKRFPKSDGFSVGVTCYEQRGTTPKWAQA